MMELNSKVQVLLREKHYSTTLAEISHPRNLSYVQQEGMDLIEHISHDGLKPTDDVDHIQACLDMLIYVARNFSPKLAILSFLEQVEIFSTSPKITVFVGPILIVLSKLTAKRVSALSWVFKTFNGLTKKFPKLTKSQLAMDDESFSLLSYYGVLCKFYESLFAAAFVPELSRVSVIPAEKNSDMQVKQLVRNHLIQILGEPLIYFDLSLPVAPDNEKSEARVVAERICLAIAKLSVGSDIIMRRTLEGTVLHLKNGEDEKGQGDTDDNSPKPAPGDENTKVEFPLTQRAVGNYFYLMFVEKLAESELPSVRESTPEFRLQACITLGLAMLEDSSDKENESAVFKKGILLVNEVLNEFEHPIPAEIGETPSFFPFLEKLTHMIALCSDKETRKLSIDLLKRITTSVDPALRSKIVQWIFDLTRHDSLYGFFVTIIKDSVRTALDARNPDMISEFCGPKLRLILNKICQLDIIDKSTPGPELLGQGDRVISILNFLRFLYIRDGGFNESGFQEEMNGITQDYLKPLKSLVELSLQQFQLQLTTVTQGSTNSEQEDVEEASVIIDGVETFRRDIPIPEQIASLQSSVFTLDLISDLLNRVEECRCSPTGNEKKSN